MYAALYRKAFLAIVFLAVAVPLHAQTIHYYICAADTFTYPDSYDGAYYKISFGDGQADSGSHIIKHIYVNPGTYPLKIQKTENGKTQTLNYLAHSGSLPALAFSPVPHCYQFDFQNSCPDSILLNGGWHWDFGDGTNSTEKSPTHLYQNDGHYSISLSYARKNACSLKSYKTVVISSSFTSGFDYHVNGNAAIFLPRDSTGMHYHWDFGDKDTTDSMVPVHTYKTPGKYPVALIMESKGGCVTYYRDTMSTDASGIHPITANANVFQAYPNPFRDEVIIHYELTGPRQVNLTLYDMAGRQLAILQDGLQYPGRYDIPVLPSRYGLKAGFYLVKAYFGEVYLTQKLVLQQ